MMTRTIHLVLNCDDCGDEDIPHIYNCFWCTKEVDMPRYCLECLTDHVMEEHEEVYDVYATDTPL